MQSTLSHSSDLLSGFPMLPSSTVRCVSELSKVQNETIQEIWKDLCECKNPGGTNISTNLVTNVTSIGNASHSVYHLEFIANTLLNSEIKDKDMGF